MPFFDIFASPRWSPLRMRTKVASFFIFFQELSNKKKFKALRPKMTKIASRGGGPALTLSCEKTALREQHREREIRRSCRSGGWQLMPSLRLLRRPQPSGQQLSTGASVEGGDTKVEVVPQLYTSVLFVPHRKWFQTSGLIALSNESGSA